MPLFNTIKTHFIGSSCELKKLGLVSKLKIMIQLLAIVRHLIIYNIWTIIIYQVHLLVDAKIVKWQIDNLLKFLLRIPIVGEFLARYLNFVVNYLETKIIPKMEHIEQLLETTFQMSLVDMTLKNTNVKLMMTGEKLVLTGTNGKPNTSVLLANHRSIMDYVLINYMVNTASGKPVSVQQYLLDVILGKSTAVTPNLKFVSWGTITNVPTLPFIANIIAKDENTSVAPSSIKKFLDRRGNQVLAIFPEVNIITPEVRLIQRKLTREYHLPRLHNLLYPRFKNFVAIMKCFAHIQNIKRTRQNRYVKKVVTKVDKLVTKAREKNVQVDERQLAKLNLFLGSDVENSTTQLKMQSAEQPSIGFNEFMWDVTIVYYQPKLIKDNEDTHVHHFDSDDESCRYKLEEITPSFMQFLSSRYSRLPIIVRVDVNKHRLSKIIPLKDRKLEKWLEGIWCEKDGNIDLIGKNIKIT